MTTKFHKDSFRDKIAQNSIDVFITSASFEDRCFVIPRVMSGYPLKTAIVFLNNNESNKIIKNAEMLSNEMGKVCELESLDSDSPINNYVIIETILRRITSNQIRPNLLIDSTTFTHESLLVLLKLVVLKKEQLGSIYFAYVGAIEYSTNSKSDDDKWLSKGVQKIRTVLGYPGLTDPTQKNHLMILFGFESERTKRLIEEYEYEYISLGFAEIDHSIQSNHQKINFERHQRLLVEYPKANKFIFSLTDPIEAKNQILEHLKSVRFKKLNTVIAPLNNKISTIGAGLAAIENENIQIAYAKPNIYNINGYSVPSEDVYLSELIL
jgi:hypothetical protein